MVKAYLAMLMVQELNSRHSVMLTTRKYGKNCDVTKYTRQVGSSFGRTAVDLAAVVNML